ncbi:hypothetical protein QVD17_08331 [Tagetes erecta]|uniref:Uncharacterized protein n=1 Tax=Tagetes erecta TaxID=13708 RepID=A0AAD8L2U9_TARER|nr:hypothetical protein QVD17_08331 [Tagetes erecta]
MEGNKSHALAKAWHGCITNANPCLSQISLKFLTRKHLLIVQMPPSMRNSMPWSNIRVSYTVSCVSIIQVVRRCPSLAIFQVFYARSRD